MKDDLEKEVGFIKGSGLFDESWYLKKYPDVEMTGMDPVLHYVKYGWQLMRDPGPEFSSVFYVETNPVVKKKKLNPFIHFLSRKDRGNIDPESVLYGCYQVAKRRGYEAALRLARKLLVGKRELNILEASDAAQLGDRSRWMAHVNLYLKGFDLYPVTPLPGEFPGNLVTDQDSCVKTERSPDVPAVSSEPPASFASSASSAQSDDQPLVSVIMPAWNSARTLKASVNSILKQTWRHLELIIVDDASEDDTWRVMQELANQDSRIRIIRNDVNVGPYVSKNIGLSVAKGLYVTGQDSDDWSHAQRIEKQVEFLVREGKFACLASMLRIGSDGEFVNLNKVSENTSDGACRTAFISLMVQRNFFRTVLGHWDNVRFAADSEVIRRIEAVLGETIDKLDMPLLFCLDNPEGLTNDPLYGHSPTVGVSPVRLAYKQQFTKWHESLRKASAYIDFKHSPRRFPAPDGARNDAYKLERSQEIVDQLCDRKIAVDVCIITNLNLPGGNASSTLEEVRFLQTEMNRSVALIHCPGDLASDGKISPRYYDYLDICARIDELTEIRAETLIVRHPVIIGSEMLAASLDKIQCNAVHLVVNNSCFRIDGAPAYDTGALVHASLRLARQCRKLELCPIGPLIRAELQTILREHAALTPLSQTDWNPTFNLKDYHAVPKRRFGDPVKIGRHGRDGREKWLENRDDLTLVYPSDPHFEIFILGGARNAEKILGRLESNWKVIGFGGMEPARYLQALDVFVYFPNNNLTEAFGRSVVEAMIAGVPCVLPRSFEQTFGELAIYADPKDVRGVIESMRDMDEERVSFLLDVQRIVSSQYASEAIRMRLEQGEGQAVESAATQDEASADHPPLGLSERSRRFKLVLEARHASQE